MSTSRRQFLTETSLGLVGAAAAAKLHAKPQDPTKLPPGAPSAFGAGPGVGPEVSAKTFGEAEKLVQVELAPADRQLAADSWRQTMAALYERRSGPRRLALEPTLAPYSHVDSFCRARRPDRQAIDLCVAQPILARYQRARRTSPSLAWRNFRDGSSRTSSLPRA